MADPIFFLYRRPRRFCRHDASNPINCTRFAHTVTRGSGIFTTSVPQVASTRYKLICDPKSTGLFLNTLDLSTITKVHDYHQYRGRAGSDGSTRGAVARMGLPPGGRSESFLWVQKRSKCRELHSQLYSEARVSCSCRFGPGPSIKSTTSFTLPGKVSRLPIILDRGPVWTISPSIKEIICSAKSRH